jgi:hypothetical protein
MPTTVETQGGVLFTTPAAVNCIETNDSNDHTAAPASDDIELPVRGFATTLLANIDATRLNKTAPSTHNTDLPERGFTTTLLANLDASRVNNTADSTDLPERGFTTTLLANIDASRLKGKGQCRALNNGAIDDDDTGGGAHNSDVVGGDNELDLVFRGAVRGFASISSAQRAFLSGSGGSGGGGGGGGGGGDARTFASLARRSVDEDDGDGESGTSVNALKFDDDDDDDDNDDDDGGDASASVFVRYRSPWEVLCALVLLVNVVWIPLRIARSNHDDASGVAAASADDNDATVDADYVINGPLAASAAWWLEIAMDVSE